MSELTKNELFLSPAPHVASPITTQIIMRDVLIALAPVTVYGIYLYSWPALIRIILSVGTAVASEAGFRKLLKKDIRIKDLSAVVTGLLLALVLPPLIPLWIVILSSFFAIIVAKEFFGGLGANPFNPALIGRAFAFVSFSQLMTSWVMPHQSFDAMSTATPLAYLKLSDGVMPSMQSVVEKMGVSSLNELYVLLFTGNHAGCIGESSALLILVGFVYLLWRRVLEWRITVSMVVVATVVMAIAGYPPVAVICSGGLLFGAVFMATDYATSPVTPWGRLLFGAGCGLITALMRLFAGMPEGVMFSILIMNSLVPFLNRIISRKYGFVKPAPKAKAAQAGGAK